MQQSELWSSSVALIALLALAGLVDGIPVIRDTSSPIDCSIFGYAGQCVECPGYPTQVSGANIDFHHYTTNWTTPNPTGDAEIAAISNAINTVLPLYSTFSPPLNVNITLVPSLPSDDLGDTSCVAPDCTYCTVLISQHTSNGTDPSFDLEQTTAHELYHCIQYRNQANTQPDIYESGWWIEGSAEYFANKFYQDNSSGAWFKLYNPNKPLYNQTGDERAGLFFQFLSNYGWDDSDINGFVIQQIQDAQAGGSEPTIMSNNADLQNLFPIFAQKFIGLAITFPDGNLAQGNPSIPINTTDIPLNLTTDGQQQSTTVEVGSFTMAMYTTTLQPGITYSIQWAPSTQDGKTVLAYQPAANVSGSTWITVDPALPVQIPIDCSNGATQYQFLLTSTADDASNGQLTFVRQSSQSCGCNDVGLPPDPCLSGDWVLNDSDLQTLMAAKLSQLGSVTISNLAVTGAATFELPQGNMGNMTYDDLTIDYDGDADGLAFHTTIDVTGSVSGNIIMQAPGQFCWANAQGQGVAHTSTTLGALSQPYVFDVPLTEGYAGPAITVNYTCSATSLQMVGYSSGQYSWALSYTKN